MRIAGISLVLLVPCFWHQYLEAGDLGSHLYNVWLVDLIHQGRAPGLWISNQWNNVLFDWLISGCVHVFGFASGDKVAAAISVLLFFWGAVALIAGLTKRLPWFVMPVLAAVAYGWTFNMGFFNFYLSVALSFWALAILASADGWQQMFALPLLFLTYVAHPLGFAWATGAGIYIALARRLPTNKQWGLVALAAVCMVVIHFYIWNHYWVRRDLYLLYYSNGADQLVFTRRYYIPAGAVLVFGAAIVLAETVRRRREHVPSIFSTLPVQLYVVVMIGVWTLPTEILFPQYAKSLSYILERLSLISAVLACAIFALVQPRRSYGVMLGMIASVYFVFLYQETSDLNRKEMKIDALLASIGPNQRIVGIFKSGGSDSRIKYNHMLDRQCIGRCYSLENYEPITLQFRVRANPDSPILATPRDDPGVSGSRSRVAIPSRYFPIYEVYQRSSDLNDLAVRRWSNPEKPD
jgi:hypothetical protein